MRIVPCVLLLLLVLPHVAQADEAEKAWFGLVEERYHKNEGFQLPEYDPDLPSVLIYGDSISMGYQRFVQRELKGRANVYRIYTNGGNSSTIVPKMKKLRETMAPFVAEGRWPENWDVIQVNVGLHDLKYLKDGKMVSEGGTQVHTLDEYKQHLTDALDYLKETSPDATIVYATTTPVPENSGGRAAGDAARYNTAAREVLEQYPDIVLSDLYSFTKPHQSEWWTKPGNVHYTTKGQKAQGKEVARVIGKVLKARSEGQ